MLTKGVIGNRAAEETEMTKILNELLAAAEANLVNYIELGDERAIAAGTAMVEALKADIAREVA